jgi:hypothetical protein
MSALILKIQCIGGSAGCYNEPPVVQCYNRGSNGANTQVHFLKLIRVKNNHDLG